MRSSILYRILGLFIFLAPLFMVAQVSVNPSNSDPDPSAMLDVQSTEKGVLLPRMTSTERDAISNPATGLMIFNVDDSCFNYYSGMEWIVNCGGKVNDLSENIIPKSLGNTWDEAGLSVGLDDLGNKYIAGYYVGSLTLGAITLTSADSIFFTKFIAKLDPKGSPVWASNIITNNNPSTPSISVDKGGNVYVAGANDQGIFFKGNWIYPNGAREGFLIKYNTHGQAIWLVPIKSSDVTNTLAVHVNTSGNVYLTGNSTPASNLSIGNVSPSGPNGGVQFTYLAQIDSNGQVLWVKRSGNSISISETRGTAVCSDAANNSFITGTYQGPTKFGNNTLSFSIFEENIFVVKYNSAGQVQWENSILTSSGNGKGLGRGIDTDSYGNVYVTGSFNTTLSVGAYSFPANGIDGVLAKYNSSGQLLWAKHIEGAGINYATSLTVDGAGNSYLTGYFENTLIIDTASFSSNGLLDIFVAKFDASGQLIWAKTIGGTSNDEGLDISINSDGNCVVTGSFQGTMTIDNTSLVSKGGKDILIWSLASDDGKTLILEKSSSLSSNADGDSDSKNEIQYLSLNGDQLSISKGNAITLNTPSPTLSFLGTSLSIQNGNSVNLVSLRDNLGDHIADQNLELGNHYLSGDGDNEGIFINTNGRVGIGTETPSQALEVNGNVRISSIFPPTLDFYVPNSSGSRKSYISSILNNQNATLADQRLDFHVSNNTATGTNRVLSLIGNKRVGIGTITPESHLHLSTSLDGDSTGIQLSTDNGTIHSLIYHENGDLILRKRSIPNQLVLDYNGNVGIGTNAPQTKLQIGNPGDGNVGRANAWLTWSDKRLKRDFEKIQNPIEKLEKLNGYYYYWKEGMDDTSRQVGVIAQEIESVLPELITIDEKNIRSVDYAKLTALLIEVNKEHQKEIQLLKAQNQSLRTALNIRLQAIENLIQMENESVKE